MAEMTIRRFGVLSVAKMYSLLLFVLGLIIGVLYGLAFMILGASISAFAPQGEGQAAGGIGSIIIGLVIMVAVPIFYAVVGFLAGAIGALIYNLAAGVAGGVKFELESAEIEYAPPPAPQQWAPQYPAR